MAPLSSDRVLLHGNLDLWISEARCLPNMDMLSVRLNQCFPSSCLSGQRKEEFTAVPTSPRRDSFRNRSVTSDPYVTVRISGAIVARTAVISNAEFPVWNEHFAVPVAHETEFIEFLVKENDFFGAEYIGSVMIPARLIISGNLIRDWFPIIGPSGKPPKLDCALLISVQYRPVELNSVYKSGIAGDPQSRGVQGSYFPLRKGGMVTLYQDAHVNDGELPEIELEEGQVFDQGKCWEDICEAILEARHLVYIVGWSVYDKVRLVREPTRSLPKAASLTLGELLMHKSEEGVRVCLLIWDDRTSRDHFFLKTEGVMQTHDEETRKFFRHSSVICVLSPRDASSKLSIFRRQVVGNIYTHHQKCVLVDTHASQNTRKITAFLGGLDLCDGRYDTPSHRLFKDLDTVFLNDFHNPTLLGEKRGPRQPWHDLHCKIEGPAAYDVLKNFEQRWQKAIKWWKLRQYLRKATHHGEDALLKLERIPWILSPSLTVPDDHHSLWVSKDDDPASWHVQVFRSIDSGSVRGFPKTVREAEDKNLVCQKNLKIDRSIQTAYIEAIRSARHFIYIENQYFIGSSFAWPSRNPGADNLIPMELALKIASKIRADERFAVYVVIPMWPEGVPSSAAVQEILYWQSQTMRMMYQIVAEAIKSSNSSLHPTDYLNFYCLGNRELGETAPPANVYPNSERNAETAAQKKRRFMIYVHSKGMIVDDEYLIMGSANINQRSLAGSRDTEIAMGAYQPHHTWSANGRHPRGSVYGYRMSLWAEHLGLVDPIFLEPQALACLRKVNSIASTNWNKFISETMTPLQGHLLKYPITIDSTGNLFCPPGHEEFPDVGGKILGSDSPLPDALTM